MGFLIASDHRHDAPILHAELDTVDSNRRRAMLNALHDAIGQDLPSQSIDVDLEHSFDIPQ